MFALNEYLSTTGDFDWFINATVPFYPVTSTNVPPGAQGKIIDCTTI